MRLVAYPVSSERPEIRPASIDREWMDELPNAYGYRCLPLAIANTHGWEILCPNAFGACWNGGRGRDSIKIDYDDPECVSEMPSTHFGSGILTFHPNYLFRSERGIDLCVQGPTNRPKDGIAPLTGVIETDWAPYTFTMNWIFTRPGHTVRFEAGEPFCMIHPISIDLVESVEPEIKDLATDIEAESAYRKWAESREVFNIELLVPNTNARQKKWQKDYYKGIKPDGSSLDTAHRTKLRLRPFDDQSSLVKAYENKDLKSSKDRISKVEYGRPNEDAKITDYYIQKPEITKNEIESKLFLVNPDTRQKYHINVTGAALWQLLKEPLNQKDAVAALYAAFPEQNCQNIDSDVAAVFHELKVHGLIKKCE